jgi:hypothetical protein
MPPRRWNPPATSTQGESDFVLEEVGGLPRQNGSAVFVAINLFESNASAEVFVADAPNSPKLKCEITNQKKAAG